MTSENDWPGRLRRARIPYASRSIVMVLTAMHLPCTDLELLSTDRAQSRRLG
jgi:hypothetical protein